MEEQEVIREQEDDAGILTWVLDAPGETVNLLDRAMIVLCHTGLSLLLRVQVSARHTPQFP